MLIRHTLRYLPAQLLSPLAQLASMIAWTHWLNPAEMGAFTLVVTTQELAYLACLSWFSTYALRSLPGLDADAAERRRFLHTESGVMLAGCGLLTAIATVVAWMQPGGTPLWQLVPAIGVFFVSRAASAHYAERARAQSAFGAYTVLQLSGPVLGLVFGVVALQTTAPSALVLWAAYALAQTVGLLLALPWLGIAGPRRPDRAVLRQALAFGGPMLGLSALGWIAENHLRYLVQWQSGAAALGLMAVGWGLGRRCASVASMLVTTAAFPLAARLLNEGRRGDAVMQLSVNAAMLLGVLWPVTAGLALIGPALIEISVAPAYRAATVELLWLAALSGAVRCLHVHVSDQWLVLERRFAHAAWVDVIEIGACIVASIVGLWAWGLPGAVVGQAVGSAVALAASLCWTLGRGGLQWPWGDTLKVSLATLVMTTALASFDITPTWRGITTAVLCGAVVYLAAIGLLYSGRLRRMRAALPTD